MVAGTDVVPRSTEGSDMSVCGRRLRWLSVLTVGSVLQFGGCVDSFGRSLTSGVSSSVANSAVSLLQGVFLQPIVDTVLGSDE